MFTLEKVKKLLVYKSFKIHLLAITLFIFVGAFSISLWYIYRDNKTIALKIAQSSISKSVDSITGYVSLIFKKIRDLSTLEGALISSTDSISIKNESLLAYMSHGVEIVPELTSVYVTGANGNALVLYNIIERSVFSNSVHKEFQEDYRYAFQFIDRSTLIPKETWVYKDANWVTKKTVEGSGTPFDSRQAPWFIGAVDTKKPFWTPIYMLHEIKHPGIGFGAPLFDNKGNLIAVTGSQIVLEYISYFLEKQTITKNSKITMMTDNGFLIAASNYFKGGVIDKAPKMQFLTIDQYDPVISSAYDYYVQNKDSFFQYTFNNESYTAFITPYTSPAGHSWLVAVVMPTEDILGEVWKVQLHLYYVLSIISCIAIIWITYFAQRISKPISMLAHEVDKVQHLDLLGKSSIKTVIKEIDVMQKAVNSLKTAIRSIAYYVPKEVVRKLFEQGKEIELGGERKELVMFFSDVQDFTTVSETLSVEQLQNQLTDYFEAISHEIIRHEGTIDKYIGDGVLAFWGAPSDVKDAPFIACYSALLCQAELLKMNTRWKAQGKPQFLTRIGLHVGNVIVGNIGTKERMNYSIIGDPVNLASRLEGVNKIYHTKICVSEDLYEKVKDRFLLRPLDIITVKGKTHPTKVFELIGLFNAKEVIIRPTDTQIALCKAFEEAFNLFHQKDFTKACELFLTLSKQFPEDYLLQFYLARCKENTFKV